MKKKEEDAKTATKAMLVALNNLDAAFQGVVRLQKQVTSDVQNAFQPGPQLDSLIVTVSDGSTALSFSAARDEAVNSLVSGSLHPGIRSAVSEVLGADKAKEMFRMSEEGTIGDNKSRQDSGRPTNATTLVGSLNWVNRILEVLELQFQPFQPFQPCGLSDSNAKSLYLGAASYLATRLFSALRRLRFSALGSLKLDKDVRSIVAWFVQRGGRDLKDAFIRLHQFTVLLTLDRAADVGELWNGGKGRVRGAVWQMTGEEVKKVLLLREDFRREEVHKAMMAQ